MMGPKCLVQGKHELSQQFFKIALPSFQSEPYNRLELRSHLTSQTGQKRQRRPNVVRVRPTGVSFSFAKWSGYDDMNRSSIEPVHISFYWRFLFKYWSVPKGEYRMANFLAEKDQHGKEWNEWTPKQPPGSSRTRLTQSRAAPDPR